MIRSFGVAMALAMAFSVAFGANICDEKISEIKNQIEVAKQVGNTNKLDGLNTALKKLQDKCDGKGDGMVKQLESKISKIEKKIDETKGDIATAKAKFKVTKAKAEEVKLKTLEKELEVAKKSLADYLAK